VKFKNAYAIFSSHVCEGIMAELSRASTFSGISRIIETQKLFLDTTVSFT